jgi:hypothetical protein
MGGKSTKYREEYQVPGTMYQESAKLQLNLLLLKEIGEFSGWSRY